MDVNYYPSNKLDPHITATEVRQFCLNHTLNFLFRLINKNQQDDREEELEDLRILDTDGLLLAATTDSDLSHLAFYVYEEEQGNCYVHHDVLLGAYPLCMAWMNINPKDAQGNFNSILFYLFCFSRETKFIVVPPRFFILFSLDGCASPP